MIVVGLDPKCGSPAGYQRHRKRQEVPCASCRDARNADKRRRAAEKAAARPSKPDTTADRFWSKVSLGGPIEGDQCWEWSAFVDRLGYGRFSVGGRRGSTAMAHRVAWQLLRGEIPAGLELDHLCRNRRCVNPFHLDPVTHAENSRRSTAGEVNSKRLRAITHCKRGHEFTAENTRLKKDGARRCRSCERLMREAKR